MLFAFDNIFADMISNKKFCQIVYQRKKAIHFSYF